MLDGLTGLVGQGFTRAVDLHQTPDGVSGWAARILPRSSTAGRAEITDGGGKVTCANSVALPSGFLDTVERTGWLVLHLGELGLPGIQDADQAARLSALTHAAVDGRVVAALVRAHT